MNAPDPTSRQRRPLLQLGLLAMLVLSVVIAAVAHWLAVNQHEARLDQLGLVVASYIREAVPGLRTPEYWPVHGPAGTKRNPEHIPFVYTSTAFPGGCNNRTLDDCLAFRVSSEIVARPDRLASLARFLENPCASFEGVAEHEGRSFKTISHAELARLGEPHLTRVLAWRFFGCGDRTQKPRTLIVNVVDSLDDPGRIGDSTIEFRIVKEFR